MKGREGLVGAKTNPKSCSATASYQNGAVAVIIAKKAGAESAAERISIAANMAPP